MKNEQKKPRKAPLQLRLIAWTFPKVEFLFPALAARWFHKLFFSTVRFPYSSEEERLIELSDNYLVDIKGKKVQVYEWGDGAPVLLVHGWMGRGTQFRHVIPVLANAGYKVITFDATGHGRSEGQSSHLMHFVETIRLLHARYGAFEAIVGHSLGGIAAFHATLNGMTHRLVMINTPTSGKYITEEFRRKIGASPAMVSAFEKQIQEKYGRSFESYSVQHNLGRLQGTDLLLIHDDKDREVSLQNSLAVKQRYKPAQMIITSGLGHTRILSDAQTASRILEFVLSDKTQPDAIRSSPVFSEGSWNLH